MTDLSDIRQKIGTKVGTSRWYVVEQKLIDQFSASTHDDDPMHLDAEWSRKNTPFGGTIAAGFWTTSMLIPMSHDIGFFGAFEKRLGNSYALNYGFNKHRLISPVPVGSRIRGHMILLDIQARDDGNYLFTVDFSVEIENEEKPALTAEWLALIVRR